MTDFQQSAADLARARDLARVKFAATAMLGVMLGILFAARYFTPVYPALSYVAAFAEAAAIGGLADWYAVVALFRAPLGLPIPHTAVIQRNQAQIADKLGGFIELHFLGSEAINTKLRDIDFAAFIADWLDDRQRASGLAKFVLRLLPDALDAAETSGLKTYLARRVMGAIQSYDLAPLAAGTLRSFISEGRHKPLLDDLMGAVHKALNEPETLAAIREKIRAELPTLLNLYRADAFLLKKIVNSASAFFDEVQGDDNHPFRSEVQRMVMTFVDRLETDPEFAARLDGLKQNLLSRPELDRLIKGLWQNIRHVLSENVATDNSPLHDQLTSILMSIGKQLSSDSAMRSEINLGVRTVLSAFIAEHKSGVSGFISDQVKSWDMSQLVALIELNVGKDLQYIRFNGMVIGGLAGLVLHAIEQLIRTFT